MLTSIMHNGSHYSVARNALTHPAAALRLANLISITLFLLHLLAHLSVSFILTADRSFVVPHQA